MESGRDRLTGHLHVGVAAVSAWLIATSPWIGMYRRVPKHAGFLNTSHLVLGFAALALAALYLVSCTRAGRWQLYFPWLAGKCGAALRDLGGLVRGRIPSAEGGGLFAVIEGLTLLLLLAAALTGAAWFFTQGSADALAWRGYHIACTRVLIGLAATHVVTVSLHLFELIRD